MLHTLAMEWLLPGQQQQFEKMLLQVRNHREKQEEKMYLKIDAEEHNRLRVLAMDELLQDQNQRFLAEMLLRIVQCIEEQEDYDSNHMVV
jgi:hypothetical protein